MNTMNGLWAVSDYTSVCLRLFNSLKASGELDVVVLCVAKAEAIFFSIPVENLWPELKKSNCPKSPIWECKWAWNVVWRSLQDPWSLYNLVRCYRMMRFLRKKIHQLLFLIRMSEYKNCYPAFNPRLFFVFSLSLHSQLYKSDPHLY